MRELTKSFISFSLASSLFGLKQMENLLSTRERCEDKDPATKAFDSLAHAYTQQFGETLSSTFRTLDNVQRGMVNLVATFLGEGSARRQEVEREREPRAVTEINWRSESEASPEITYEDLRTGTY